VRPAGQHCATSIVATAWASRSGPGPSGHDEGTPGSRVSCGQELGAFVSGDGGGYVSRNMEEMLGHDALQPVGRGRVPLVGVEVVVEEREVGVQRAGGRRVPGPQRPHQPPAAPLNFFATVRHSPCGTPPKGQKSVPFK